MLRIASILFATLTLTSCGEGADVGADAAAAGSGSGSSADPASPADPTKATTTGTGTATGMLVLRTPRGAMRLTAAGATPIENLGGTDLLSFTYAGGGYFFAKGAGSAGDDNASVTVTDLWQLFNSATGAFTPLKTPRLDYFQPLHRLSDGALWAYAGLSPQVYSFSAASNPTVLFGKAKDVYYDVLDNGSYSYVNWPGEGQDEEVVFKGLQPGKSCTLYFVPKGGSPKQLGSSQQYYNQQVAVDGGNAVAFWNPGEVNGDTKTFRLRSVSVADGISHDLATATFPTSGPRDLDYKQWIAFHDSPWVVYNDNDKPYEPRTEIKLANAVTGEKASIKLPAASKVGGSFNLSGAHDGKSVVVRGATTFDVLDLPSGKVIASFPVPTAEQASTEDGFDALYIRP